MKDKKDVLVERKKESEAWNSPSHALRLEDQVLGYEMVFPKLMIITIWVWSLTLHNLGKREKLGL